MSCLKERGLNDERSFQGNLVFRKLSILAVLPILSFLCFNLGKIFLFVWVVLGVQYKFIDNNTEHYLTSKVWMTGLYGKGESPGQNMSFLCCWLFTKNSYLSNGSKYFSNDIKDKNNFFKITEICNICN